MIQTRAAILGFRQDRVGARLVGLLNVLRLGRLMEVPARFVWLARPDGAWPDLARPEDILSRAFLRRQVIVTDHPPDLSGRRDLGAEAGQMNHATLAAALAQGTRFQTDVAFHAITLMGEDPAEVRAQIAALAQALPLARPLARALELARERLAQLGAQAAVHVRRGDVLDTEPWCLTGWPSKYVPDEFVAAFAGMQDGPVLAFSDTPAAVAAISGMLAAQGRPPLIPAGELIGTKDLTVAQRDVLELLLLADVPCIAAPSNSAFSTAARLVGQARAVILPNHLPPTVRQAAEAALLARLMDQPDSFLAPGDRAQSLAFVMNHAAATGQAERFARHLAADDALAAAHPFVRGLAARAAWSAGAHDVVARMTAKGMADPRTQRRDRVRMRDLRLALGVADPALDADAALVSALFQPPEDDGLAVPALMARALSVSGGTARAALLLPTETGTNSLAPWQLRLDWAEFLRPAMARGLIAGPSLGAKLGAAGPEAKTFEETLNDGPAVPADDGARWRLGHYAASLGLHGRYLRALAILERIVAVAPEDVLVHKRLADICFRLGDPEAGMRHLSVALSLSPGHALMNLSHAVRARDLDDAATARAALARAQASWPGLALIRRLGRGIAARDQKEISPPLSSSSQVR